MRSERPLRIAFVLPLQTPYRDEFLAALNAQPDFDVSVIYASDGGGGREWQLASGEYSTIVLRGVEFGPTLLCFGLGGALRRAAPELVVVSGYALPVMHHAMTWCRRTGTPYLLLSESHDLRTRSRLRRALAWLPSRAAIRGAAGFLPASSSARRYLVARGASPQRSTILPNAPDVKRIAASVEILRSATPRAVGGPQFVFVGRLIWEKDVATLISAFRGVVANLATARLVIAGSGPLQRDLEELVGSLKVENVEFLSFVQPADLPRLYAQSDIFVLPSLSETFGVVLMEAMAAGLPVIVSDKVGAAPDLVTTASGRIVRAGDVAALERAMLELAADPALQRQLAERSAETVQKWDLNYCVTAFRRLIEQLSPLRGDTPCAE